RALFGATHNQLLIEMQRVLANGLAMRDKVVHGAEHADDPVPSHRDVLDKIRARDAPGAEEAMRVLIDKANEDFDRIAAASTEPRRAG
ncbi:MAG: FCD domain-containing protein, partial [Kibdelosporangium sp.]